MQLGEFLSRLIGPLLKTGFTLIKNLINPLAKSVLIPLGLTVATSAADAGIHKEILGSGRCHSSSLAFPNTATLIISNDEMEDIIEIVKFLEDSGLLLKAVSETIQNGSMKQKGGFLSMLLGTFGTSLVGNILAGKGAGEGDVRFGYGNKKV